MLHLVAIAAVANPLWANNPNPWEVVRDDEEGKVWQRQVPNSDIKQVRIEATLAAGSRRVWEVIRDVPHHTEYMPYVQVARVIKEVGNQRWVYQRISPPIVDDRDYTIRAIGLPDYDTGVFELKFWLANADGPAPVRGVVRVPVAEGGWILEPLGPNKTRILYWLHTDPGGSVPAWIINFGQKYSLPRLLRSVVDRANDPTWRRD